MITKTMFQKDFDAFKQKIKIQFALKSALSANRNEGQIVKFSLKALDSYTQHGLYSCMGPHSWIEK